MKEFEWQVVGPGTGANGGHDNTVDLTDSVDSEAVKANMAIQWVGYVPTTMTTNYFSKVGPLPVQKYSITVTQ